MRLILTLALVLLVVLAGCGEGTRQKPAPAQPVTVKPVITGAQEDARLIVRIHLPGGLPGFRTQAITFDHALVELTGPLLNNPPLAERFPSSVFSPAPSPSPSTAVGLFRNLRPGAGYELAVTLFDSANTILGTGSTPAPFSLVAGTNLITVNVNVTSSITLPQPYPLVVSLFNNTVNASGQPQSTVIVSGDVVRILPGANDPNGQLTEIRLRLDGTAGQNYIDGALLATWFPDGFNAAFEWATGSTISPAVIGTSTTPAGAATPPPIPPPSPVPAESPAPNHKLTFELRGGGDNSLIGLVTYDLTVISSAVTNLGLNILPTPTPTPTPTPVATPAPSGTVLGTFTTGNSPQDISIDALGFVWVVNQGTSNNVMKFDGNGNLSGTFSAGSTPHSIAIDGLGNAWVSNESTNTVTKLSSSGSSLGSFSVGTTPRDVAIDTFDNVWVANNGANTVSKLRSDGTTLGTFSTGTGPEEIAIDNGGIVWIAQSSSNSAGRYFPDGTGAGTTPLSASPSGIAVDPGGTAWAVIPINNQVQITHQGTGTVIGTFSVGTNPQRVAVDAKRNVWVTNRNDGTLTKLSSTGSTLGTFAVGGSPHAIAIDTKGFVWVTNINHSTLIKVAP